MCLQQALPQPKEGVTSPFHDANSHPGSCLQAYLCATDSPPGFDLDSSQGMLPSRRNFTVNAKLCYPAQPSLKPCLITHEEGEL